MSCDIELHLTAEQPQAAVDLLLANCDLSKTRLKTVMQCGAVWLTRGQHTRRVRRAKSELLAGDLLHMYYDPGTIDTPPPEATLIVDEGDYSVWFKPSGMFTQGTKWGDHHTITRWAEQHLLPERTAKIVHRLDRHTSGLILIAHSKTAAAGLSALFREREMDKQYQAIVVGVFGPVGYTARIELPVEDKTALSDVTVLQVAEGFSLLNVKIGTGRKHQIRRHLSESGFPIVGDLMYGTPHPAGLQLSAVRLAFECPITTAAKLYLTPPETRPKLALIV